MGMGRQAKPEYQVFKASEANGDKSWLRNHAASKPLDVFLAEYQSEMEARVAVKSLKPGSLKAIKETFVKMRDHFGSTLLSEISAEEIDTWLKQMPVCQRTRERHRSYAVQIFNKAKKFVPVNPAQEIDTFKSDDKEIHVLSVEEVTRLLEVACSETKHSMR
jgi:site-specific recombinase XerD